MASKRITVLGDEGQNQKFRDDKLNGNVGTGVERERRLRYSEKVGWKENGARV